jgi:hypothetical protein
MHVRRIRVFVSSPNEVKAERDLLDGVVDEINRTIGETSSFVLQLFMWERNQIDQTPQDVFDSQMSRCEIYLGILRTRFGTPTGNYGSGTEQEFRAVFERFKSQGKPWISFYFYNGPVELRTQEEREQYDKVCKFRDELERESVVGRYKRLRGRDAFVEQVRANLIKLAQQFADEAEKVDQLQYEVAQAASPSAGVQSTMATHGVDIFVSYAKEDREVARKISKLFEDEGWSVWWDRKIPLGRTWRNVLEEAMQNTRCTVVLWSANSINNEWVKEEAEEGKAQGKLVPILIESVQPPMGFRTIQAGDLIGWNGNENSPGLQQLLAEMTKIIQPSRESDDLKCQVTMKASEDTGFAPSEDRSTAWAPDDFVDREKYDRLLKRPTIYIPYEGSPTDAAASSVEFGAFSPRFIVPKSKFILDIWAYTTTDYATVCGIAKTLNRDLNLGRKVGVLVSPGTVLTVQVDIPSLVISETIDTIEWKGEPANASFIVEVPDSARTGTHPGTAVIGANGIRIARLSFLVFVDSNEDHQYLDRSMQKTIINSAFASYATEDREEVLSRIHGMKKIAPDLDIFLDVLSLRSGDDWEKKLEMHVPSKDSFFLFWSKSASQSEWVDREWRLAFNRRGQDYIDPVPLVDPREVPPPAELNKRHFADAYVAYIHYERMKRDQLTGNPKSLNAVQSKS